MLTTPPEGARLEQREAVIAAVLCARQFGQDLFIVNGRTGLRYGIFTSPRPTKRSQACYRVTPTGQVMSCGDFRPSLNFSRTILSRIR